MTEKKVKTETKVLNIYQRLNAVMGEVSYVKKEGNGGKGLPYKSVSHDTVTKKLHGPLQRHGVIVTSDVVECSQDGNRTEIKLAVSFINIDDPKDVFTVHFYGHGVDQQDKGIGKAISYAMKYCLLKTFLLESGPDDDVESHNIDHEPAQNSHLVSPSQVSQLEAIINGYSDIRQRLEETCGGDIAHLPRARFAGALKWVTESVAKKGAK